MFDVGLNEEAHVHSPGEVIDRRYDWWCKRGPENDCQVARFHHVQIFLLCYPRG
jgi:hypothetical protein